jgi:hypothetical protein
MTLAEPEELSEAGQGGGDEQFVESAAEAVEQDRDVLVLVGVDTDAGWSGGRTGLR